MCLRRYRTMHRAGTCPQRALQGSLLGRARSFGPGLPVRVSPSKPTPMSAPLRGHRQDLRAHPTTVSLQHAAMSPPTSTLARQRSGTGVGPATGSRTCVMGCAPQIASPPERTRHLPERLVEIQHDSLCVNRNHTNQTDTENCRGDYRQCHNTQTPAKCRSEPRAEHHKHSKLCHLCRLLA